MKHFTDHTAARQTSLFRQIDWFTTLVPFLCLSLIHILLSPYYNDLETTRQIMTDANDAYLADK